MKLNRITKEKEANEKETANKIKRKYNNNINRNVITN